VIVAVALVVGGLAAAWFSPVLLWRMIWRVEPSTAILAWVMGVVGVLGSVVAGVVLLFLPGHGPAEAVLALMDGCRIAMLHHSIPTVEQTAGAVGMLALLAGAIRFAVVASRHLAVQRRAHRSHLHALRGVARCEPGRVPVMWLAYQTPLAYSIGGRPGLIVATDGLNQLPARQVDAVLAHEHAHLRGRHHTLITIAEALATSMPLLAVVRQVPAALRLLVELGADASAVRRCGPPAVRGALLALAGQHVPGPGLAMASEMIEARLDHLANTRKRKSWLRRLAAHTTTALIAGVLPAATGLSGLVFAGWLFCLAG
jgi:beta-lactamase regulating signal transducer with metallopeptidase domain